MNEALIKEVFSDEEFVSELLGIEFPEDAQKLLEKKGISLSLDEINQIKASLDQNTGDELNEDDLENVAGGLAGTICMIIGLVGGAVGLAGDITHKATRARW